MTGHLNASSCLRADVEKYFKASQTSKLTEKKELSRWPCLDRTARKQQLLDSNSLSLPSVIVGCTQRDMRWMETLSESLKNPLGILGNPHHYWSVRRKPDYHEPDASPFLTEGKKVFVKRLYYLRMEGLRQQDRTDARVRVLDTTTLICLRNWLWIFSRLPQGTKRVWSFRSLLFPLNRESHRQVIFPVLFWCYYITSITKSGSTEMNSMLPVVLS